MQKRDHLQAVRTAWLCCAEGDGASGGGGNGSTPAPATTPTPTATPTPTPAQPDWNKFFASLGDSNAAVVAKLSELNTTVSKAAEPPPPPEPTAEDIDGMSNSQFGNYLLEQMQRFVRDTFTEGVKPLNDSILGLRHDYTLSSAQREITSLQTTHKDFGDWNDEMIKLATGHPTLSIPQLYALARSEDPTKAKQLDEKYNPPVKRPSLFAAVPGYGGLNGAGNTAGNEPQKLTKREATSQAIEEVAGRHPILAALLEQQRM